MKTINEITNFIYQEKTEATNLQFFKGVSQAMLIAIVMSIILSLVAKTVKAETTESLDIQHLMKSSPVATEGKNTKTTSVTEEFSSTKTDESTSGNQRSKTESVSRPEDGTFPSFEQADVNNDHYLTKEELKNFPYLLKEFDMVDAGKDGKLEQHEYLNLEMETKK